jgi:DNA-binding NarL/FixJ family response regulator
VAAVNSAIRVLIVDDDPMVRSGLRLMLERDGTVTVVADAEDGGGVLAAVDRHRPDVVLMDIRMHHVDGIVATRLLRAQPDPPAVLVLTTFDADELVLRALQAGAAGFLLKHTVPAEIVRAIQLVHAGQSMLSPSITRRMIDLVAGSGDEGARQDDASARLSRLSPRELEVAYAVARGLANPDIASELHMSVGTVKAHVTKVFAKLAVDNRVQISLLVQHAGSVAR